MPHVRVWVDSDEALDDMSDEELRAELVRRARKGREAFNPADYAIPQQVAASTLDEASSLLRRCGRADLAFKLDEIKVDFVGN